MRSMKSKIGEIHKGESSKARDQSDDFLPDNRVTRSLESEIHNIYEVRISGQTTSRLISKTNDNSSTTYEVHNNRMTEILRKRLI